MTIYQHVRRTFLSPITNLWYWLQSLTLPPDLRSLSYDKPVHPVIPTYEGSGQAVHPDIMGPLAGIRPFVLAFTPYPFSADRFENPSVLISHNGLRFFEEFKGINPLVPPPEWDHNDDPDLFFSNGYYNIVYLETMRPQLQNLIHLSSLDRKTWSRKVLETHSLKGSNPDPFILSPAYIAIENTILQYFVNAGVRPHRIEYRIGESLETIHKEVAVANINGLQQEPWHIDIVTGENNYSYMLISTVQRDPNGKKSHDLIVARSKNLRDWDIASKPVFLVKKPFGTKCLYRSTAWCSGTDIFIYFSYETRLNEWRIGVVRKRITDLFPHTY